ncbi:Uncharacterised protein [BD1-7 clade bacterium]|uniref:Acid-resistance membrane protein n=1 Tax=BD1-7 clade bacterium TaxID=2029982 RepID=A0A5S9QQB5_9GAMM|nr:Uncharacterised protein [BD1-7 clade bacterium]CAA0120918.1 Uncharacterised protein [BD1-7 clade bacterium]
MPVDSKTALLTLVGSPGIITASKKKPWLVALVGVFLIGLGGSIFAALVWHPEWIAWYVGSLVVIASISELIYLISIGRKRNRWAKMAIAQASLYLMAGPIILSNPVELSQLQNLSLGWLLLLIGIVRFYAAMASKGAKSWLWTMLGGFLLIFLGVYIIAVSPIAGILIIALLGAVEALFNGAICLLFSYQAIERSR